MVASLSLIDATYYVSLLLSLALAFLSTYFFGLAYVAGVLLLFMLYLVVVRVPLALNWSRNLYSTVLVRAFSYGFVVAGIYAVSFYSTGGVTTSSGDVAGFMDCLYFSLTTFTSLGYGDLTPQGSLKLLSSLEAMNGLLTLPIVASIMWLYCKEKLWDTSMRGEEVSERDDLVFQLDPAFGVERELPNETKEKQQRRRDEKFHLASCRRCGSDEVHIEKYWDPQAPFSPFPTFVVMCECGVTSELKSNAYAATVSWNLLNETNLNEKIKDQREEDRDGGS